jgi:hypothetical protein
VIAISTLTEIADYHLNKPPSRSRPSKNASAPKNVCVYLSAVVVGRT